MLLNKLIIYVRLLLCSLTIVYAQDEEHREENGEETAIDFGNLNICDIKSPTIIYCYCNTVEENEADNGSCWIFNDTSEDKYKEVWESFASQTRMKHLSLHLRPDGTLKIIPTVAIMFLPDLERFDVQYASISSLHSFCFGNSSSIESISLIRNSIEMMDIYSFANLPSLVTLKLGENNLLALNTSVFSNLPKLRQLFIDRNNISEIENFSFKELDNLEELDLYSNEITTIAPETFLGLTSLQRLDLHKNLIQVISDMSFQDLKSLQYLNLKENSIKYISPKGLFGLKRLRKLYLQDNKLMTLEEDVFKYTRDLLHLDLRQNVLETLTIETMKPLSKNLKNESMSLHIKENVLRCDNRLLWIFKLYNSTLSKSVKSSLEEVYCYLEMGSLPTRLEDQEVTPTIEVTTMGIGPRTELLKLHPSELPDPLIRSTATLTEEECEEELKSHKIQSKKDYEKHKRRLKSGKHKGNRRRNQSQESEEATNESQNDMTPTKPEGGDMRPSTRDTSKTYAESNSNGANTAATVLGNTSSKVGPSALIVASFLYFYYELSFRNANVSL